MSDRIRWEDKTPGNGDVYNVASIGYAGTVEESAFIIYTPDEAHAGWLLSVRLTPGSQFFYGSSQDELKAKAEDWLAGFVSSLGAIFPETNSHPDGPTGQSLIEALGVDEEVAASLRDELREDFKRIEAAERAARTER